MSEKIEDGGTAYPYREQDCNGQYRDHFGMTLRDYFAAAALPALVKHCAARIIMDAYVHNKIPNDIAKAAYATADAMLAARKEGA